MILPNVDSFRQIHDEIQFVNMHNDGKTTAFTITKDYRSRPSGAFFQFISNTNIDLTDYQLFNTFDLFNYHDNCFAYACIQSHAYTNNEIEYLRPMDRTRFVPNDQIKKIAKAFGCKFIIYSVDETQPIDKQIQVRVDTRSFSWAANFNRSIDLLLYKEHYMIYKNVLATQYYIKHKKKFDKKYNKIPQTKH